MSRTSVTIWRITINNYIVSHRQQGYEVIAKNEEFGKSALTGALAVRIDSGIETLHDLKGKKIVFGGGPKAMQGYIIPKYLLMQAGLKTGDYQETTSKDPSNAAMAVFHKQADAGGIGDITLQLENLAGQIDATQMKYIATGEPMAHLPWAVRGDLAPELRAKLQAALAQIKTTPEGQKALEQAGFTNIVPATDAEYQAQRQIIRAVHGEDY
jgi:phosphonate transport system substrate-binding protein